MTETAPPSDASSVIYVRVPPDTKALLKRYAERDHGGNMAAAIRFLLDAHVVGKRSPGNHPPGYLDED